MLQEKSVNSVNYLLSSNSLLKIQIMEINWKNNLQYYKQSKCFKSQKRNLSKTLELGLFKKLWRSTLKYYFLKTH